MSRIISASLSPNTEPEDVLLALRLLCTPWMWKNGMGIAKVEAWFRQYLGVRVAVSFNSGRSAELALLKSFGIGRGDEVIVQAFTCVAVPNSVRWMGAVPVFADIDETYNMDPSDFEKKITKKTKAVIIQHTFGIPAKTDELLGIARKHNLIVIEDCAHALGATYLPRGKAGKGKKVGTLGGGAFFSFGRDKVISSIFGGLATISPKFKVESQKLKDYHKKLDTPSFGWIFKQLFHPVAFACILPLYTAGVGKALLVAFQRLGLLSFPVYPEEKFGRQPGDFPAKYPNALALLLLKQLKKLERLNEQRRGTVSLYVPKKSILPGAIYLRFPMMVDDPASYIAKAKKHGILLGNWYHHIIDPTGVAYDKIGYTPGSCPRAEQAAKHILNLPTRISEKEAKRVVEMLNFKA